MIKIKIEEVNSYYYEYDENGIESLKISNTKTKIAYLNIEEAIYEIENGNTIFGKNKDTFKIENGRINLKDHIFNFKHFNKNIKNYQIDFYNAIKYGYKFYYYID